MSANIYEFRPEITRSQVEAGIRRARVIRSEYFSDAFSGLFRKGIKAFANWNRRHNQTRHLEDLPDYLLKDIGLERYQIDSVVSGALERDPLSLSPTGIPASRPAFTEDKLAA
jgi:uncharacterized protein YjiS (DUF1127 family)